MFHLDTVFEWIVNGTVGQLTRGTIPLVIWLVITFLLWLGMKYVASRWGGTKWVGTYIYKTFTFIATAGLVISIFTTAYGYRGTPIDATAKNLLLVDPGPYKVVAVIHDGVSGSENGKIFAIVPLGGTPNWEKIQMVYAANFQIQLQEIQVNDTISVLGYQDFAIFGPKVNLPGEQPEQQQLTMTTTTDDH